MDMEPIGQLGVEQFFPLFSSTRNIISWRRARKEQEHSGGETASGRRESETRALKYKNNCSPT
jgi:hypothetical protein